VAAVRWFVEELKARLSSGRHIKQIVQWPSEGRYQVNPLFSWDIVEEKVGEILSANFAAFV